MTNDERNRAARLRRKLNKLGYTMRKTNWRRDSIDNFGGYAIIDTEYNAVVRGSRFDLDLDDVEEFISEEDSIAQSDKSSKGGERFSAPLFLWQRPGGAYFFAGRFPERVVGVAGWYSPLCGGTPVS